MSSDTRLENVSTRIIDTSEYTSVFGTRTPTAPPTANLLSSLTTDGRSEFVYGVSFTDSSNAPFTTSFTLSSTPKSSTTSDTTRSDTSPTRSDTSSTRSDTSSTRPDTSSTQSESSSTQYPSASTNSTTSASESSPAIASATATRTPHNGAALSSGATAGIAVACAILGAIIAAAVVGYLMRRPRQRAAKESRRSEQTAPLELSHNDWKRPTAVASNPHTVRRRAESLTTLLVPPVQDRSIVGDFSKLGTSIKNHALSFYGTSDTPTSTALDTRTVQRTAVLFGSHPQFDYEAILTLLKNPHTRATGVRIALISAITKGLDPGCEAEWTLLPPEFARCMDSFKAATTSDEHRTLLLSRWRHINGSLLEPTHGTHFEPDDARWPAINRMAEDLDLLLRPFSSPRSESDRQRNMIEILKRGARFGYMLLTQPTEWTFDWTPPSDVPSNSITVHPGLMQTVDDQGRRLTHPIRIGERAQCVSIK